MELDSPRNDPYSTYRHRMEELARKGYTERFEIIDESQLRDGNGRIYTPHDLVINEIHRLVSKNNESEKTVIYAISTHDNSKGTVVDTYGEKSSEVVDNFLQKVDTHDNLHEK